MRRTRALLLAAAAAALAPVAALPQTYDVLDVPLAAVTASVAPVKSAPGPLLWVECFNPNAAPVWLQFFDTASSVVLGTTAPTLQWEVLPLQSTGLMRPNQVTGAYYAGNSMQVAATTTSGGSAAPPSPVSCDFGIR